MSASLTQPHVPRLHPCCCPHFIPFYGQILLPRGDRTPSCLSLPQRLRCLGFQLRGVLLLLVGTSACGRTCLFLWAVSLHVVLLSVLVAPSPWSPGRSGYPSSAADLQDPSPPTPCLRKGGLPQALRPRSTLPSAPLQPLARLPAPWLGHTPSCHQPLLMLLRLPRMFLSFPFPPFGWDLSPQGDWPHTSVSGRGPSWRSPFVDLLNSLSPPRLCSSVFIYNRGF